MILPNSSMQKISSVRSHTQAISQCQKVITENKLEPIIAADTAGSAKYISENKIENEAAIASELAAEIYNLKIVKKNIEERLNPEFEGRFKVMLVPNITNICYGRGVGYKIEEIELSKEIQEISATKIRAKMREEGKLE